MNKEFDNLEQKVLVKGDCGHYHTEDECEVVVVKIVKGKQCNLGNPIAAATVPVTTTDIPTILHREIPLDIPEDTAPRPPKKNIIPPGITSMMYPPGDPRHESHGAKERRVV